MDAVRPSADRIYGARLPTPAALVLEALLLNRIWPGNPVNRRYRCLDLDSARSER